MQKKLCPEALWLGAEIAALAKACNLAPNTGEHLKRLTEKLAEAIFSAGATCLFIDSKDDADFLKSVYGNKIVAENAEANAPLVFDFKTSPNKPVLYFRRHFFEETIIAQKICELESYEETTIAEELEQIICAGAQEGFPFALNSEQRHAVRKAVSKRFTLISGGSGTGKTTLLMRALICLRKQNPDAKIAIAAPTGKAASRIRESIAQQIQNAQKQIEPLIVLVQNLNTQTIHKLCGISQWNPSPRTTISADIVVIDEASMISQTLMATLLRLLNPNAKLILLGDKNQLDSVDAGHIFGDLCAAETLRDARVELTESQRFSNKNFLGRFASAVLAGKTRDANSVLTGSLPETAIIKTIDEKFHEKIAAALTRTLPPILKNLPEDADPKMVLSALETSRILSPLREGPFGVDAINELAGEIFAPHASGNVFHGQPILITQNDEELSLSNGDIGIIMRSREGGKFEAWFASAGGVRNVSAAFLPTFETAYAMTVHKSQGSEFSRLTVVLPPTTNQDFYTRQLLYTALTRFKENAESTFSFLYSASALDTCIENTTRSRSLLQERLKRQTTPKSREKFS